MKADEVRRYQRQLIALGYLEHGQDDGVFGPISMDAFNRYRATKGLKPLTATTLAELEAVLFPSSQPPKGLPMDNANVDVKSAWLSTKNWAAFAGLLSVILPLFGIHLPVGWSDTVYQAIAALSAVYILVKNTWFTTTITAASAKKL